jgi:hypothetical protein
VGVRGGTEEHRSEEGEELLLKCCPGGPSAAPHLALVGELEHVPLPRGGEALAEGGRDCAEESENKWGRELTMIRAICLERALGVAGAVRTLHDHGVYICRGGNE